MGRILLSYLPQDQLEQYLAKSRSDSAHDADRSPRSKKLRVILRNIRRTGYALCDQEYEVGLRSLAVPIFSHSGRVVATLNLSGNAPRLSVLEMQSRFLTPLRIAANEMSAFLN